ncbi:MAG: hypothetical protein HYW70_02715 [Candidatus Nealsonbacteria bacterium]|nr:hypothetical protein [Candidatus Nealsonbacteria bacterium]
MSIGKAFVAVAVFIAVLGIIIVWNNYNVNVYPLKQGVAWIDRAKVGGSANEMIEYGQKAQEIFKYERGNPAWWYATDTTNWDLIKKDLASNIKNLEKISELSSSDEAYQQGMDVAKDKFSRLKEQADSAADWTFNSGLNVVITAVFSLVFMAMLIVGVTTWDD